MTQANESLGLTASQHIERIQSHCPGMKPVRLRPGQHRAHHTRRCCSASTPAKASSRSNPTSTAFAQLGVTPVTGTFVREGDVLRHDYDRVAEVLLELPRRA